MSLRLFQVLLKDFYFYFLTLCIRIWILTTCYDMISFSCAIWFGKPICVIYLQAEAAAQFLKVMKDYTESLCSELRSYTITSVQSNNDRVEKLMSLFIILLQKSEMTWLIMLLWHANFYCVFRFRYFLKIALLIPFLVRTGHLSR